jgi:type VI protein secretion system component VasF
MGDDELNFTEEEARSWAGDPRNQPAESERMARVPMACILLVAAIIIFVLLLGFSAVQHQSAVGPIVGGSTGAP